MDRDIRIDGQTVTSPPDTNGANFTSGHPQQEKHTPGEIEISEKKENRMTLRRQAQPNILVKIQDFLFLFLSNWKWFFLSLAICLGYAYYQIKKTPNLYQRSAAIMIKSDETKTATNEALKGLGMEQAPTNVNNELMALTTSEVANEVVKKLDLETEYYHELPFTHLVVYGNELPVNIKFHNIKEEEDLSCRLKLDTDGTVTISQIKKSGESFNNIIKMKLGQTRKTSIGIISVLPTDNYQPGMTDDLIVYRASRLGAINTVLGRLHADLRSAATSIIDLTYYDYSPQRAEDILNAVVEVYNQNWINDQNRMTVKTNEFIRERLNMIEQELSEVEQNIATYKSDNLMPDVELVGANAFSSLNTAQTEGNTLDNQIYMTQYLKSYITDGLHIDQLIPTNQGLANTSIESQIVDFNNTLLLRNGHLAHSSEQNPLVKDLEEKLVIMRSSIIQSLDNELIRLRTMRKNVDNTYSEAVAQLIENPAQVLYVKSVERQKNVKESLYLFLLQKREENELTQAFAAYNSRLIEPPHGSWAPIEPIPQKTYMMAFIIGLAIPAAIIIIKEGFNTVIRGRKDLDQLSVPFVGEIPLDGTSAKASAKNAKIKKKRHKKGKHHTEPTPELVVMEKSRNVMNEAFRVVRSNLEFILGFDRKHNIVMVTSLNPGSGKTFITANLASSLGLNNKRVIAIDLDMRKGSLSKYVDRPTRGVSNYLSGQVPDYKSLIIRHDYIDMLPCGTLPPNPTELLYGENFRRMLEEVRRDYDYVFLDCPPVEVVADSAIINPYADMTLFVIRAQLMDRAFLPDVEHWYEEKRYKSLSIILNGTTDAFSRYGYHKYGYRYGYHYGNYGYGYGNTKE